MLSEVDHGLDRKRHAGLAGADGLVPGVVWDVGRRVVGAVDAVADVVPDHVAPLALRVPLDGVAEISNQRARLDQLYGLVEGLARGLDHAHRVRVRARLVPDVVGLVQVGVVAVVVERDVQVDDVPVDEGALVGYAVADDLVHRRAHRLGEAAVVERRRVRLIRSSIAVSHAFFSLGREELEWDVARAFLSTHASWTIRSISSVVMPGRSAAAARSRTSLAMRQTWRIFCWAAASRNSILFSRISSYSPLGIPSTAQFGAGMDLGTFRGGDSGYTGRRSPV